MTAKEIKKEMQEILKRNNVKSLIKFSDKLYDDAKKSGLKTKDCGYLSNNQDYIRAYALEMAYNILERNEDIQHFLNRPTTKMWLNGLDFQKKIINLTVEIIN